jgi:arylsulfatase/uncharacterized sulfatase
MGAIGAEWASAAAVPGSLFKMYASEGGTRVPLIVRGPGIEAEGFNAALTFVTDVAPTIADLAGLGAHPQMDGRSLAPLLRGEKTRIYGEADAVGLEVAGNAALFKGRYKLTRNTLPHGDAQWRLHDLERDPAEARDLSSERPELRRELLADYRRYAAAVGVVALPESFDIQAQINLNTRDRMLARSLPTIIGAAAFVVVLVAVGFAVRRGRRRRGAQE